MGVSIRVAGGVLFCVLAFLPRGADAAPIIAGGTTCDAVGLPDSPCTLAVVDPVSATLSGEFEFDNDFALFQFELGAGDYTFTAASTTAATGVDPILSLFGPTGTLVTFSVDGGDFAAVAFGDSFGDDAELPVLTLSAPGTYTLAVSQFGIDFGNFPIALSGGTLSDGFEFDLFERCFFSITDPDPPPCEADAPGLFGGDGQTGVFSLAFTLTPADTAPVPEPGTLSLIAVAAAGALLRRRRARPRPENHS